VGLYKFNLVENESPDGEHQTRERVKMWVEGIWFLDWFYSKRADGPTMVPLYRYRFTYAISII